MKRGRGRASRITRLHEIGRDDLPDDVCESMTFVPVDYIDDVLAAALRGNGKAAEAVDKSG